MFELVPEHFSIADIREAYEAILGEKVDKRNFSKKVKKSPLIEALEGEESKRISRGRKARLYRFRKEVSRERGERVLDFKF